MSAAPKIGEPDRRSLEMAILRSLFHGGRRQLLSYTDRLNRSDFTVPGGGEAFEALVGLIREHGHIDSLALGRGLLDQAEQEGWWPILPDVVSGHGNTRFLKQYVDELMVDTERSKVARVAAAMTQEPDRAREYAAALLEEPERRADATLTVHDLFDDVWDVYHREGPQGVSTGWECVDELFRVPRSYLTVIGGWTHHGKSAFLDALLVNVSESEGLRHFVWSPENWPYGRHHVPYLAAKRARMPFHGGPKMRMDEAKVTEAAGWVHDHFRWVDPNVARTSEQIFSAADRQMRRWPFDTLVVDPFTEVARPGGVEMREFIWDFLGDCRTFVDRHGVHLVVVVHPRKPQKGQSGPPRMYDLAECHDERTEVLTEAGWKPHGDVTVGDRVACFDSETTELRYEHPTRVIDRAYEGPMHHWRGESFDACVTPRHRMVLSPAGGDGWSWIESQDVPGGKWTMPWNVTMGGGADPEALTFGADSPPPHDPCPTCRSRPARTRGRCARCNAYHNRTGGERPHMPWDRAAERADRIDLLDLLQLVGWWVSEGWNVEGGGLGLCQNVGPLRDEMRSVMDRVGLVYSERAEGRQWKAHILRRAHPEFVDWMLDQCGSGGAGTKRLPGMVWGLTAKAKGLLLGALIEGDGHLNDNGHASYSTASHRLANEVQRLAIESGRMASLAPLGRRSAHHLDRYQINIARSERTRMGLRPGRHLTVEHYRGRVYCLTVPTGAYVVRRNGKPGIYGNSANWGNRADLGVMVHQPERNRTLVETKKVRHATVGRKGRTLLKFDPATTRLSPAPEWERRQLDERVRGVLT